MQLDTLNKFSATTLALHWIVGLTMIILLAVGIFMVETETFSLYPWHKSFGVLIILVVVPRVFWRIKNGWPSPVSEYSKVEQLLAKIVHYVLILGTLLMPLSGFLMSSLGGNGVEVLGLELVARNPDPEDTSKVIPHNETLGSFFHAAHHWVGYLLVAAVVLHVVGALKHHVIDKDGSLNRMLGSRVETFRD
ncbi:cytochrome b [Aestuariirhabdus sp. Z084]|uniref:cytochrome b n=1 Tax=Aestuariirhabdus haliotis TaxID=2918751 RepID=UPI0020BFE42D|nr:cytochrome b [Aestuariirhabdus haliotis]MCL6415020.1 cytochrome b [Aestuariirhabdus haliotis]MCL6418952.1 cytochrome b [Aestuariirhabdus haliotis]